MVSKADKEITRTRAMDNRTAMESKEEITRTRAVMDNKTVIESTNKTRKEFKHLQ